MSRLVATRLMPTMVGIWLAAGSRGAAQTQGEAPHPSVGTADATAAAGNPSSLAETPVAASARAPRSDWPAFLVPDVGSESALLVGPVFARRTTPPSHGGRISVLLSWLYAPRETAFAESHAFAKYGEATGQLKLDYSQAHGRGLSIDGLAPVSRHVAVQLGYSHLRRSEMVQAAAEVPHLLRFSQGRAVHHRAEAGSVTETALHAGAAFGRPLGPTRVSAFAGLSLSLVGADLVEKLVFTQVYPYDADNISVVSMPAQRVRRLAVGPDIGLALDVPLFPHMGIGAVVRYSGVSVRLRRPLPTAPLDNNEDVLASQVIRPAPDLPVTVDTHALRFAFGTRLAF